MFSALCKIICTVDFQLDTLKRLLKDGWVRENKLEWELDIFIFWAYYVVIIFQLKVHGSIILEGCQSLQAGLCYVTAKSLFSISYVALFQAERWGSSVRVLLHIYWWKSTVAAHAGQWRGRRLILLIFFPDFLNFLIDIGLSLSLSILNAFERIELKSSSWVAKLIFSVVEFMSIDIHGVDSLGSEVTGFSVIVGCWRVTLYLSHLEIWRLRIFLDGSKTSVVLIFWNDGFNFLIWCVFFRWTHG